MDIYPLLKNDHEEVISMLDELISLNDDDDYHDVLVEQIAGALIPHSRAEESVFYNTLRAVKENSKVMHSFAEHAEAEALLRALQVKDRVNMNWKKTAIKLRDALFHHIAEEESTLFEEARACISNTEAESIGEAFKKLKSEIEKEGFVSTSLDMVINLMPPRFIESIRHLKSPSA